MRKLEEIIADYESLRESFKDFSSRGDNSKDSLLEFQHRFVELKADLRPWHTDMLKKSENRSDKQATAIKARIGISMVKGEFQFNDDKPMYDKPPTISSSDKYAAATKQYKEFLDQRTFYKESFVNIADLREDIGAFIVLIRDKHNR